MTKYREILRLYSQGISKSSIARSCECSRNTVISVISRAEESEILWPLPCDMTDGKLQKLFFPSTSVANYTQVARLRVYPQGDGKERCYS